MKLMEVQEYALYDMMRVYKAADGVASDEKIRIANFVQNLIEIAYDAGKQESASKLAWYERRESYVRALAGAVEDGVAMHKGNEPGAEWRELVDFELNEKIGLDKEQEP